MAAALLEHPQRVMAHALPDTTARMKDQLLRRIPHAPKDHTVLLGPHPALSVLLVLMEHQLRCPQPNVAVCVLLVTMDHPLD